MKILFENSSVVIAQQEPTKRTILVDGHRHFLSFPYVIFYLHLRSHCFHVFFSKEPLKDIHEPVWIPPLPNVFGNGGVCMPNEFFTQPPEIKNAVKLFWSSDFEETELGAGLWTEDEMYLWRSGRDDGPLWRPHRQTNIRSAAVIVESDGDIAWESSTE